MESAQCPCEGCEGIEDGWHCVGECVSGNAGKLRRGLVEEFGRQVDKVDSLGGDLRWAIKALWSVDEEGRMCRWEDMEWEEFEEKVGGLSGVDEGREQMMGRLCMERPATYRVGGWLTRDWEEVMEESAVMTSSDEEET